MAQLQPTNFDLWYHEFFASFYQKVAFSFWGLYLQFLVLTANSFQESHVEPQSSEIYM